ncbi:hypothetical protein CPB83DRAFT_203075 [Crepidotus variabilis]|uniref:HIG1 domain-containing protein n=1 Tax=Crepidotus variabilis TaxID=179855 RepID=A0A9P6JVJ9_9AGAR|nr:hypothetical protein CPB83DRAFT_203075 [Crepidotus variabilis]
MKINLNQEQVQEHTAASRRGAIEGAALGASVGLAGSYWAQRRLHAYQRLPLSLKALGIIIITAPCLSIQAERRGLEYDRSQWVGAAVHLMDERELEAEKHWESLSLWDKVGDWSYRHQYSLIMGSWAGSLGVAAAIISRNKYQTYPQKIVQARMWAQGLTIGLLIVAGALTHSRKEIAHHEVDHSWRDILEQQERDRKEHAAMAAHVAPAVAHSPSH